MPSESLYNPKEMGLYIKTKSLSRLRGLYCRILKPFSKKHKRLWNSQWVEVKPLENVELFDDRDNEMIYIRKEIEKNSEDCK